MAKIHYGVKPDIFKYALTIDPFIGISVFITKLSKRQYAAGVFSRAFIVKNISNSLTYTVASSCVCTSPLAVLTVVGLHDFVQSIHFPFC